MEDYKLFIRRRKIKQLIMASIFILILIFGWRYSLLGIFIPACMALGIGIGLFRGRKWCDWMCPRGSFYDVIVSNISPKKNIPAIFRKIIFRIIVLFVLMAFMLIQIFKRLPDINKVAAFFILLLTITTAVGVILAVIFHPRTWCSICPVGTLIDLTGKKNRPKQH